jgi:hypothetical protein
MKFTGATFALRAACAGQKFYLDFSAAKNSGAGLHSAGYWKLNLVVPGFAKLHPPLRIDYCRSASASHNHQYHILHDGKHGSVDHESKGKDFPTPTAG